MTKVILIYPTPDGSVEIVIENEKTSFGRGSETDHYFDDEGLSRLHATVYREGDRVWIVDENSTNGTSVNGVKVSPGGTPLTGGETINIGNHTRFTVKIVQTQSEVITKTPGNNNPVAVSSKGETTNYLFPIAIIAFAVLIIGTTAVFVGISVFGGNQKEVTRRSSGDDQEISRTDNDDPSDETTDDETPKNGNSVNTETIEEPNPEPSAQPTVVSTPSGKTYLLMDSNEKTQYVESKSQKVARMIGNKSGGAIPSEAVAQIRKFVDAYVTRVKASRRTSCGFGDNLEATYERAAKNAPFIIKDFYSQGVDPQIGLYLAMIESEHCPCLESPTKALGLFQFLASTSPDFGLDPKDRCDTELASKAAAKYMKTLSGRFGTGPLSMPLAIGSYNSGQGALSKNLETALKSNGNQERSFWTLVANAESLSKQFQVENIKYVPKFYAAAIIGENPQDFGMNLQPLSTYTN